VIFNNILSVHEVCRNNIIQGLSLNRSDQRHLESVIYITTVRIDVYNINIVENVRFGSTENCSCIFCTSTIPGGRSSHYTKIQNLLIAHYITLRSAK